MKPRISIGACRRAIGIATGSLPLMIRGEQVLITEQARSIIADKDKAPQ